VADQIEELDKDVRSLDRRLTTVEANYQHLLERAKEFITRNEFTPVKLIAYGLISATGTALFLAMAAKVFIK